MRRFRPSLLLLAAATCAFSPPPSVHAAILATGNVEPSPPALWTSGTNAYVAHTADGTLTIDLGDDLVSNYAQIGYGNGTNGVAAIDGPGSTWTIYNELDVGVYGSGTLNIMDGGAVSTGFGYLGWRPGSNGMVTVDGASSAWNSRILYVGYYGSGRLNLSGGAVVTVADKTRLSCWSGSTGALNFGDGGGTLSTKSLAASANEITGTGTINTRGLVCDVDLVFDSIASLTQTLILRNQPDQNVTVNLDLGTSPSNNGDLGAGWRGNGSLTIRNGVKVVSQTGYIGHHSGSTGTATVTGLGSSWSSSGTIYVGNSGNGTLNITGGGAVSSTYASIGGDPGSVGAVTVDGAGSTWTNSGGLYVGNQNQIGSGGQGTLNISDGGVVSTGNSYVGGSYDRGPGSIGVVNVDAGSTWTISGNLVLGASGSGALNIRAGGNVTVSGAVTVGAASYQGNPPAALGTLSFGPGGGTLTARSFEASPIQIAGTGTVNARGLVSDIDLVFDSIASLKKTFRFQSQPDQNVTLNLDMASDPSGNGSLGAGWKTNGSLTIRSGVTVNSEYGVIGQHSGSTGVVTVTDAGSRWVSNGTCYVGYSGTGTLNVTAAGAVSTDRAFIGAATGARGTVNVDGTGSAWTNSGPLYIGSHGYIGNDVRGELNIRAGGSVTNRDCYVGALPDTAGVVTVEGINSTWRNNGDLYLGADDGSGVLNISGGATVSVSGKTVVTPGSLAAGAINFGEGGGNLTTRTLMVSPAQLTGSGTINLDLGGTLQAVSIQKGAGVATFNWNDGMIRNYGASTNLAIQSGLILKLAASGRHAFHIDPGRTGTVDAGLADATTDGTLAKTGAGTLTLTGVNTYTGSTTVEAGWLKITGSIHNTAGVTVDSFASLELAGMAGSATAADIEVANAGTALVSTVDQEVGLIAGPGATQISAGASLCAGAIRQDTLSIGAGGSLTIRQAVSSVPSIGSAQLGTLGSPADGSGTGTVPEPSAWLLLAVAALASLAYWWRWGL